MSKQIFLTGIQPTASGLHLGNYVGAIKPMIDLQNSDNTLYAFVADLHAITNPDIELKPENKKNLICTYIAAGIDPKKTILFYQSDVPAHTQLG
jgi:tryptophanyl-tRNA synthetase